MKSTKRLGKNGTGNDDPRFDQFWSAYPRRVGKGKAREQFARAMTKTTLDAVLSALEWQRRSSQWLKDGGQFIPHPATWLHQERWDDQPVELPSVSDRTARTMRAIYGD